MRRSYTSIHSHIPSRRGFPKDIWGFQCRDTFVSKERMVNTSSDLAGDSSPDSPSLQTWIWGPLRCITHKGASTVCLRSDDNEGPRWHPLLKCLGNWEIVHEAKEVEIMAEPSEDYLPCPREEGIISPEEVLVWAIFDITLFTFFFLFDSLHCCFQQMDVLPRLCKYHINRHTW